MRSVFARRSVVASIAVLVAALFAPNVPHATAATAPTAAASQTPAPSAHDAPWRAPNIDGTAAQRAFERASSAQPSTGSSNHQFQSANPPSPCYYSLWSDPQGDAPELDVVSYGALYDCSNGMWTFPVTTHDAWASSELDTYLVQFETDGNLTDGCNGTDYALIGGWDAQHGNLTAGIFRVTDCTPADWPLLSLEPITRANNSQVSMAMPNSAIGGVSHFLWTGAIAGKTEAQSQLEDDFPDGNTGHSEDGYLGTGCTVGQDFGLSKSYTIVDNPQAAAAALQAAGQPGVIADQSRPGAVHFAGDPTHAGAVLAGAGIAANISQDLQRHFQSTPNDTDFGQQWSLPKVGAPQAWDVTTGSPSVIVGDLDSGVDGTHPDLAGKLVPGEDFTGSSPAALNIATNTDTVGHGTATAGLIGAATNNTLDVASLGYSTMVMPVKVGDANGVLASSSTAGIMWATDHGAKVINMSYGSPCTDSNESAAVTYAQNHGVLLVASAGNEAQQGDRPDYPAAYPGVLSVGATDANNNWATYSNFGSYVDMAAPGGLGENPPTAANDILVLAPGGGTAVGAGTSFSAPLVSAAGALLAAVNPNLTATSMRSLLMDTATDVGPAGRDATTGVGVLNAALAVQTAAARSKFNPLPPTRILDTRNNGGPLGASQTRQVQVTGGSVPSNASAVIMNVTAVEPTAGSYLTVFPSGANQPLASNLNFSPGQIIPNLVVVRVGSGGNVSLYNAVGNVNVILDLVGWYGDTGDSFTAVTPTRILDTRNGPPGKLTAGETRAVQIEGAGNGAIPATGVTAAVINVTAVEPSAGSYLTVYPSDATTPPTASNLNFPPGVIIPNLVVVKVGSDGKVNLYNAQGNVDVLFDVVGYYSSTGSSFSPLPPHRVLDTRDGTGGVGRLGAGDTKTVQVAGVGGTPTGISAVVLNVTAVQPSTGSFLTVYPSDAASLPTASNLNFPPGAIIPNLVVVKVGSDGKVKLYNAQGTVDVIFDVVGWFT
ncbi:MAG: S8 family serine peptidase [Acidimicrobiia bacterium]|nr:S8 family serine peptidase [Acidimicrobiia bacterium]